MQQSQLCALWEGMYVLVRQKQVKGFAVRVWYRVRDEEVDQGTPAIVMKRNWARQAEGVEKVRGPKSGGSTRQERNRRNSDGPANYRSSGKRG